LNLDTVGHEYTHFVQDYHIGSLNNKWYYATLGDGYPIQDSSDLSWVESKAIFEGTADILGMLCEAYVENIDIHSPEFLLMGEDDSNRNEIRDHSSSNTIGHQTVTEMRNYYATAVFIEFTSTWTAPEGTVFESGKRRAVSPSERAIIPSQVYQIVSNTIPYLYGPGHMDGYIVVGILRHLIQNTDLTVPQLFNLWYTALTYLNARSDFSELREALLLAAENTGLDDYHNDIIDALQSVGITTYVEIGGYTKNNEGESIYATVDIFDEEGHYVNTLTCDSQGAFLHYLPQGIYFLHIYAGGYATLDNKSYYNVKINLYDNSYEIGETYYFISTLPTTFSLTHTSADNTVTDLLASPDRCSMYNGPAPQTWTLASPSAWQATMSGDCSWFTLDKKSGDAGTMELKLELLSGTDTARTGTITFKTLDDGKTYSIKLTQTPGTVSGITTRIDGTAMAGVTVTVSNANYTSQSFTTGEDGKFSFALPNGWYDLTLSKDGYEPVTFTSYFEMNGQNVDIGNRSLPLYLTGSITDATEGGQNYGKKISGVTVELYDSENKLMETATTDANGVFGFHFYTEGVYSITYAKNGYQTKTAEVRGYVNTTSLGQFTMIEKKDPQYVMKYFNGHTYLVMDEISEIHNWEDAKEFCERLDGHLVTITSQEENDFLIDRELYRRDDNTVSRPGALWIGFSDMEAEGTWKWVTDEEVVFTDWRGTSPQDATGTKDFAVIVINKITYNGTPYEKGWHNWNTNYYCNSFICEWDSVVDESILNWGSGTCGDNLTWTLDKLGTLTISGTGEMYDYNYYNGNAPWNSFDGDIRHIEIKNGVTSVGENAFSYLLNRSGATTISLSNDLKSIGNYAFQYLNLPYDKETLLLPSGLEYIGMHAFYGTNITNITIPATVQYISPYGYDGENFWGVENPFENSYQLITITVDENNPYFCSEGGILYTKDKSTLIAYPEGKQDEKFVMPDAVCEVIYGAFGFSSSIDNLKEMTISENLDSINGIRVDSVEKYIVPETNPYFTSIDGVMYSKDLTKLCLYPHAKPDIKYEVLDGVHTIDSCSFESCNNLLRVILPDTVKYIYSFSSCNALNKVVIPESVEWIRGFKDCRSLSDVYFYGNAPYSISGFDDHYYNGKSTLHYIDGTTGWEAYEGTYTLKVFDPDTVDFDTVDSGICGDNVTWKFDVEGVLTLSGSGDTTDYTSYYYVPWKEVNHLIRKIVIEKGITSIGDCLFAFCKNVTEVSIPDTVIHIGEDAFWCCENLTEISIPDSVLSIDERAFSSCDKLTSVTLPKNLTAISREVFSSCSSLNNVVLPDGITSIGEYAFGWCDNLTSITIPANVTAIEGNAFYHYYENLTDVYFLGNVPATWGEDVFPDHVVIHYISGKSGWNIAADGTWTAPDGTVYNTAAWTP